MTVAAWYTHVVSSWWWDSFLHPGELRSRGGYWFWSGVGACLGYLTIFLLVFRKVNCGAPWCPRVGRHPTADGMHHLCKHHHPDLSQVKRRSWLPKWFPGNVPHITLAEIHARHHAAKEAS